MSEAERKREEPTRHVVVDLETLGTEPGAIILRFAAEKWDRTVSTTDFLYDSGRIDVHLSMKLGLRADLNTCLWWFRQSKEALMALVSGEQVLLPDVLQDFADWIGPDPVLIWGKGPSFDLAILAAAYRACHMPVPWKFYHERCLRTLETLCPGVPLVEPQCPHVAVDDAAAEAEYLRNCLAALDKRARLDEKEKP